MTREEELFSAAVELPPEARDAFVTRQCGDDPKLRERLETLLADFEAAGGFFDRPLFPRTEVVTETPGRRVGRYKLLEKIGEGGCGTVWMAQQDEPVRRRVALKVIKLGMDTKEVIARFEAERQAMALMDHPNIAKVFEAGATETGRPYFAMELVRGQPITRYCDERELTTTQRLALFTQVCRAIQHAHEQGIVHRDIKPSNILVTHDDEAPLPKIIDFGIAKAMEGRLTDRTLFTAFEQFVGTPAYMSPEQADYNVREVDARSDVYSLGALLYELLAGAPPFDPKSLASAGIEEVRRIIREVDPPRLSTQLGTLSQPERTALAQRRRLVPAEHVLAVRGDLEWIVLKALDKNRERRYGSAAELAGDVARHLQHRPVVARRPSLAYRTRKFVRRHRVAFAAAAAVAVVTIAGASFSVGQARRATRAEREREELALRARGSPLAGLMDAATAVRSAAPAPDSPDALVRAREFITDVRENYFHDSLLEVGEDDVQRRAEETLAALDLVPAAARWPAWARERDLVAARLALAERRQAKPVATAHAGAARAGLQALRAAGDTSEDATVLLATACITAFDPLVVQRVTTYSDARKRAEALAEAEALLLPLVLGGAASDRARHVLAEALLARGEFKSGSSAAGYLVRALALLDEIDPAEGRQPRVLLTRGKILMHLGEQASAAENERRQREVLAIADTVLAQQPASSAAQRLKFWAWWSLGKVRRDRPAELTALVEAEKVAFALHQRDPSSDDDWYLVLIVRRLLAAYFEERGRIGDALAVWHRLAEDAGHPATRLEPSAGATRRYVKNVLVSIALLEASRGRAEAAERAFEAQRQHPLGAQGHPDASPAALLVLNPMHDLRRETQFRLLLGDHDWVIAKGQTALGQLRALLAGAASRPQDRVLLRAPVDALRECVAEALIHRGRFAEAEKVLTDSVELLPLKTSTPYTANQRIWLALALARQQRGEEALKVLAPAAAALKRPRDGEADPADLRDQLGQARVWVVEALAQPDTESGRARRRIALAEAAKYFAGLTDEARQLHYPRTFLRWIAEESAK